MMWILFPVLIFTLFVFPFGAAGPGEQNNSAVSSKPLNTGDKICVILHPLMYAIIAFLAALVLILLIKIYKTHVSMQNRVRRDTIQTSDMGESTALSQNNPLSVSPTSCDGADNSSCTSSGTPEGSLEDLSSGSQRCVCLQDRSKTSDYINISETGLSGQLDINFKDSKSEIDYVNIKESQQRKVHRRVQARCDDDISISSDESTVNYSTVVFM